MKNCNMILTEQQKQQKILIKISAWSSEKIDKYEYITGKEILSTDQKTAIEQAKFTYFPLGKAFEK